MKKIIILALLILPISIFSQSPGDRMIVSEGFKGTVNTQHLTDTLKRKIEEAKLKAIKEQKAKEKKVIAIKKEAEPICTELTKDDKNKEDSKFLCILKAIFLGGKFPGESDEQYRLRLEVSTLPATQPYK